ncbi:MAG TPA: glycosyltransferase family 4 protein [Mycobacteriales bacterium]|nr:glycosyltransferase family 4 protein [Mycobacteriales bacterium]
MGIGDSKLLMIGAEDPHLVRGGLNRYFAALADARRQAGVDFDLLWMNAQRRPIAASPSDTALRKVAAFGIAARRHPASVIEVHMPLYGLVPMTTRRRVNRTMFFHGPWAQEVAMATRAGAVSTGVRRRLAGHLYRRADHCFTASEAFANLLVDEAGVHPGRVTHVGAGVDLERFTVRDSQRRPSGGALHVFAVRRLTPRMGLETLIEAWAAFGPGPADTLRIAGEGELKAELTNLAARLGVARSVALIGGVTDDELAREYRSADISVVPTLSLEGFGLVALESLASGTPVIVTAVDALKEHVGREWPQLMVEPGSAEALARLLSGIRDNAMELPSPPRCRAFAERFTWHVVAENIDSVHERATTAPARLGVAMSCERHASAVEDFVSAAVGSGSTDAGLVLVQSEPSADRVFGFASVSVERFLWPDQLWRRCGRARPTIVWACEHFARRQRLRVPAAEAIQIDNEKRRRA